MWSDPQSLDPYRSPSLPEGPYAGKPPSGRPGLLTALCVIAIVLGGLGLVNVVLGTVALAAGPRLQALFQPQGGAGMPPGMQQAQQDFQDEMNAVQSRYFVAIALLAAFRFIAALLLLIGGVKALGLSETGRMLLLTAFGVAAAFELSQAILQTLINLETMTALNSFMESILQSIPEDPNAPPGMKNMTGMFMRASIVLGIVLGYAIVLAKLALYLGGLVYLQRQKIRALFVH